MTFKVSGSNEVTSYELLSPILALFSVTALWFISKDAARRIQSKLAPLTAPVPSVPILWQGWELRGAKKERMHKQWGRGPLAFPWQQELPDSRAATDHRERGEPGRSPSQSTKASTRPEGKETAAHSSESCCGKAKDTLAFPRGHLSWEATDAQTSLASKPSAQLMGMSHWRQNNARQCVFQQEWKQRCCGHSAEKKFPGRGSWTLKDTMKWERRQERKAINPGNTFLPTEKQIT